MQDDARWNLRQVRLQSPFGLELLAKIGPGEMLDESRSDAAADEYAAARAEHQRHVAGDRPEECAEEVDGSKTFRRGSVEGGCCNLGGASSTGRATSKRYNRLIEIAESRA